MVAWPTQHGKPEDIDLSGWKLLRGKVSSSLTKNRHPFLIIYFIDFCGNVKHDHNTLKSEQCLKQGSPTVVPGELPSCIGIDVKV